MTAPEITAALEALIASTPPPVTVWGVRYPEPIDGEHSDGTPFVAIPAGHIDWSASETEAREWLADEQASGYPAELVRITGHVHPADVAVTDGGTR